MKIFELVIDENDEISGTQYLSLVKSPANMFEWEIFNDEEPHDCSRHYDFTDDALNLFDEYGTTIPNEVLFEAEQREIELTEEGFAAPTIRTNPRAEDIGWDNPQTSVGVSRYIYVVDTGMGAPLIATSRTMCRKLILAQKVFRRSDINDLSNKLQALGEESFKYVFRKKGLGVDIWNYKMGKNDRHCWRELVFYKKPDESFEDLLSRIPLAALAGTRNADAIVQGATRPYVAEAKIPNGTGQLELFSAQQRLKPVGFHMGLFLYKDRFSCLVGEPEAKYLTKIKLGDLEAWVGANVMDSYLEETGVVIDKFKVKHKFVKVPEYIREVAERAVKYAEENGWGSCGTAVGKRRASDLASADYDPSLDVLARMYSYGSRHKQDWESSKDFETGCGFRMMSSWGFSPENYDAAMKWLERQLDEATEMSVKFSSDEYKGDITAVVFEPDTYIYRYDQETQTPYYVFMSRDTIEKLLKKFSRLKETGKVKNTINLEHSDKVFDANDVYSYENWLVGENPKEDKSYQIFGREMKPGTWITTIHFKNKKLFDEFVLSKKTMGISLEGLFQELPFNFEDVSRETFVEPSPGESEDDFISRCIPYLIGEGKTQEEAAGACYGMWESGFSKNENFAPYPWKECISDMLDKGYSEGAAERICGKIRSENMAMLGIYGGAPAYSTEGEADEMAGRLGCKGTHYEEGVGYMPCETHDEAADLYDSSLLLFELKDILAEYLSNENKQ